MKPASFRRPFCLMFAVAVSFWIELHGAQNAPHRGATNEYHGIAVIDQHQWLENAADPEVQNWTRGQNEKARQFLDKSTSRPSIEDRLTRLMTEPSTNYSSFAARRGKFFFLKFAPPAQQAVLITLGTLTNLASERVLVDPNKLGETGGVAID